MGLVSIHRSSPFPSPAKRGEEEEWEEGIKTRHSDRPEKRESLREENKRQGRLRLVTKKCINVNENGKMKDYGKKIAELVQAEREKGNV